LTVFLLLKAAACILRLQVSEYSNALKKHKLKKNSTKIDHKTYKPLILYKKNSRLAAPS